MDETEKVILFIALSNQIMLYQSMLDNDEIESKEDREIIEYVVRESNRLLDKYTPSDPTPKPISRPTF